MHAPKHFHFIACGTAPRHRQQNANNLGSKAYHLLRMARMGLPVPPALVIGTHYTAFPDDSLLPLFEFGLPNLEKATGQTLGDRHQPLIVSVRSGAPVSMPGMMETLLNVGLCDETLPGLLRRVGNPRLVWDAYRRLVAGYAEVVDGQSVAPFEQALKEICAGRDERALDFSELRTLTRRYLALYLEQLGRPFPQSAKDQLSGAVRAVFASWHSEKACDYRRRNSIDEAMGTAVTVQAMVFGNAGHHSGAGVGFTRDPSTGAKALWVDFLTNAQGEDVVAGRRNAHGHEALEQIAPAAWQQLQDSAGALEREFADMQDFEFTVQDGILHLLQARAGKRTALATARIALDLHDEGLIDRLTALARTQTLSNKELGTYCLIGEGEKAEPALALASTACSGVVNGEIALDGERALQRQSAGAPVILVRQDAETRDFAALERAQGLLTQRGARTSHAAVVARQLGKVCLVGCDTLRIDLSTRQLSFGSRTLAEGDLITLDGNTGKVYAGALTPTLIPDQDLIDRLQALRKT